MFASITTAYETLSDEKQRARYDAKYLAEDEVDWDTGFENEDEQMAAEITNYINNYERMFKMKTPKGSSKKNWSGDIKHIEKINFENLTQQKKTISFEYVRTSTCGPCGGSRILKR